MRPALHEHYAVQCNFNKTLSNYVGVGSSSRGFRIALELATRYMPPGPPGPLRLRVKTVAQSRHRPAARPRPVGASARQAQSAKPNRRRRSGVNDWEVVPSAPCSTRRTGGSQMPRPLSSRLHIRRHHASERLQRLPFQPGWRGAKAGIEGSTNGDFPFTLGKVPFRMEISHSCMDNSHSEWRFPIHAWTIPILNGDFMSILNGHAWTLKWDLPIAEWEIMARRPSTSELEHGSFLLLVSDDD
jgi:hypothetical protein